MHIPDGVLAASVWLPLDAVALPAAGYIARRAGRGFEDSRVPMLGVMGAFVFAAQMINFPVAAGTSNHLVGGALLTVTLGPAAAAVVMTAILAVQALVFQDGGLLALGANVFNMALLGVLAAWLPYRALAGRARRAGIFLAGALSVFCAALAALVELRISGVPMPQPAVFAALGVFAVTSLLEGAITVAVVGAIERLNPKFAAGRPEGGRRAAAVLALAALLLATGGALVASAWPDGLDSFLEQTGVAGQARALAGSPLADYEAAIEAAPWVRKTIAGAAGVAIAGAALFAFGRVVARRRSV